MSVAEAFFPTRSEPVPVFTIIIIFPAPPFPSMVAVASPVLGVPPVSRTCIFPGVCSVDKSEWVLFPSAATVYNPLVRELS